MKTVVVNSKSIKREWYVVDAANMVLGRLAGEVARLLNGKNKPAYSPNQDHGDYIIVINADKVRVTGKKADQKTYFRRSSQPGHAKFRTFKVQMGLDSRKVIQKAVHGMLPKTSLAKNMMRKLHVYKGAEHLHASQNPKIFQLQE
jgi:large subunit ribosomal protein L13